MMNGKFKRSISVLRMIVVHTYKYRKICIIKSVIQYIVLKKDHLKLVNE